MTSSIHDLDFIQYMLGQPDSVRGVYRKLKDNCDSITSGSRFYGDTLVTAEGAWQQLQAALHLHLQRRV